MSAGLSPSSSFFLLLATQPSNIPRGTRPRSNTVAGTPDTGIILAEPARIAIHRRRNTVTGGPDAGNDTAGRQPQRYRLCSPRLESTSCSRQSPDPHFKLWTPQTSSERRESEEARLRRITREVHRIRLLIAEQERKSENDFSELNLAFLRAVMSLNGNGGHIGGNMTANNTQGAGPGMYSSFESSPNNLSNLRSPSMSPSLPHAQVNGGGAGGGLAAGMPINAGQQMDLNHLYEMVLELSDVLKNNREMTRSIVTSAEDLMRRANTEGSSPSLQQVNGEISAARIADLERALAREKRVVEILKHEQTENIKLIGEYEAAMGVMVEQIRNYCQNNNMHFLAQKRHYNNLLQAERDAHLQSRLDRDYWHSQTMKCAEMIRTAYRLRCEEEELPLRIVSGLQNEVRAYRQALGMEPEKPEEEFGWEILKDAPPSVD
ncbi:hypothetical protein MAP00_004997 [Monascus purpureus]|nr:hypothetical protein MAP00_004997 [Monascus purpureus]